MSGTPAYCSAGSSLSPPWVTDLDSSNGSWEFVQPDVPQDIPKPSETVPVRRARTGLDCKEESFVFELDLPAAEVTQLLKASTLTKLGGFDFEALAELYQDPVLTCGLGDPSIRIARAVRAGISAGQKLRGEVSAVVSSPSLSRFTSTRWYICLWCPSRPSGFVTSCYRTYCAETCHPKTTKFAPGGVHHSFDTIAEVVAYLAGAKVQWPPELA